MDLTTFKAKAIAEAKSHPCGDWVYKAPSTGKVRETASWQASHLDNVDGKLIETKFEKLEAPQFRSADGQYYEEAALPEQGDEYCTTQYAAQMKAERNARISDTDDYATIGDITVQREAGGKRTALTDDEKAEITVYRQALRDLPETEGFPWVEFPALPECISYEAGLKISQRAAQKEAMK